jgi:uncharacterized protein (TIGR03000 family)
MYSCLLSAAVGMTTLGLGAAQQTAAPTQGAPASIHVILPADAMLTIDGMPTKATTANRWFVTPPIAEGSYSYTFKAEYVREGKTITVQQKVLVRPNQETVVSFDVPGQAVAGSLNYRALYPAESTAPSSPRLWTYRRAER